MKFLMDTHMHFDLYRNRREVLDICEQSKCYTIAVTNLPELFSKYLKELPWTSYRYVRLALGFHPQLVAKYNSQLPIFINELCHAKYVGEIGLDYTCPLSERITQREIFETIIAECNIAGDKILSIHSRRAETDVLSVINKSSCKAILHWYSGTVSNIQKAIDNDFFFSINHQMTNSEHGRKIISNIPIKNILIESDAPFTVRLEQEYSLNFQRPIYAFLSSLHHISEDEVASILKLNFLRLLSRRNNSISLQVT